MFPDGDVVLPAKYGERMHGTISTSMGSPILGDPDALVTIVEFGDYQCHFCKIWFDQTKPDIDMTYIQTGQVNLVYVDLSILGSDSIKAAQASYCAEDQGAYWSYHNTLYEFQEDKIDGGWANTERLKAFAQSLGLDTDEFDECLDSGKYAERVKYNKEQAIAHGAKATPTFFIVSGADTDNPTQIEIGGAQPFGVFERVIESVI